MTQRPSRTAQRAVPATWLNLVCLDAPLVAAAWLWLFARTFRATIPPVEYAALFLTAWVIYLGDRLADSCSLPERGPRSLRHEFCFKHRRILIGALAVIATADAVLVWNRLGHAVFLAGGVIGSLALTHLVLNYSLGGAWPPLPLKEVAIGSLFAAGTLVALYSLRPITGLFVCAGVAFAGLCTLNCLCIAFWERELDENQGKVSFATRYPGLEPLLGKLLLALALSAGGAALVFRDVALIFACVSVSFFLLTWLNSVQERINRDQRTALADLVLLTPFLAFVALTA